MNQASSYMSSVYPPNVPWLERVMSPSFPLWLLHCWYHNHKIRIYIHLGITKSQILSPLCLLTLKLWPIKWYHDSIYTQFSSIFSQHNYSFYGELSTTNSTPDDDTLFLAGRTISTHVRHDISDKINKINLLLLGWIFSLYYLNYFFLITMNDGSYVKVVL